ncbi:MAG: hypothetical protein ABSA67_03895 [Candidatus Brocadiia bacterium]
MALGLIVFATGPAFADEPSLNLSPLCRLESTPAESERSFEALWPLFEWRDSAAFEELYIRPIYNRRTDKAQKITESDWLWPFGFGTGRPDVNRQVVYPLFLHENETASDGSPESRTILLPLLYQHSRHGVSDLLIFPFGGVLHNFLDRQKIVIVLWPIYVYQRSHEAQDWSILFPIFSYIRWDDGSRGFKFWPLIGINQRPNKFYRLFALWPIIHYENVILPQGTIHAWAVWPFYSSETGPGGWDWSVAWPFISGHFERNETQHWFPWPFLGRLSGEKVSGWTFWPAFSITKRPEKTDGYYLWPLGWFSRKKGADTAFSFRLIPLMFYESETRLRKSPAVPPASPAAPEAWSGATGALPPGAEPQAESSGAWQVWPLVKHRSDADGARHLEVLSLFPLRWYAPWERNFAPFFRVFEYERAADGETSWRALWRLWRVDRGPAVNAVEFAPLFRVYDRPPSAERGWSALLGLIACDRTQETRTWRLLYLIKF